MLNSQHTKCSKQVFILFLLLFISPTIIKSQVTQVNIEGGKAVGKMINGVAIFKGIPFAAPPVGELRWKAPQPVKPWEGILNCTQFGPSPMQSDPEPFSMWSAEFLIPKEPISEDCLYLNVWSASTQPNIKQANVKSPTSKQPNSKKPVLVWIYGGGFGSGGSAVPIYDGQAIAQKDIVFVSINYRVGPFGFFAHPDLTKESGINTSGNYGLLDQIAALQWVKRNISAFGGDPKNVTIAGQSAGSMSVNYLVASPLAKGLFNKAIAESGAAFSRGMKTLQKAEKQGVEMAESILTTSIAALRDLSAAEVLKKLQGIGPIIDGYVLPDDVEYIFSSNKQNPVALLTGWNEEEGLLTGPLRNAEEYQKFIQSAYNDQGIKLLTYYPASSEEEAITSQMRLSRDLMFGIPNYNWANKQTEKEKVFVYRFARKVPGTGEYAKYGAFHTGEVPYVFDNLKFVNRPWEKADHQLAGLMSAYWVNFVKYGNPNAKGLPVWPAYQTMQKEIMWFDQQSGSKIIPDQDSLDFLSKLVNED